MTQEIVAARRDLLALVLDALVPASGGFPGAGTLALDHVLAMAAASVELERLLSDGLRAVEAAGRAAGVAGFASLNADDRETVLRRVEQSHALLLQVVQHAPDVGRVEADVMETLAAPREEAPDAVRGIQGLEELDLAVAGAEERGADALVADLRLGEQREAQGVAVEAVRVGEPVHHDSDVMDPSHHG